MVKAQILMRLQQGTMWVKADGDSSDREVLAVSVQEEGPRRWASSREKLL